MTNRWLPAILAAVLLALTYLLARSMGADSLQHERIVAALHRVTVADAALHRDALKERAGLLPNYDSLVDATRGLREAVAALGNVGRRYPELGAHLNSLAREADAQEDLIEVLKSDNAVLKNSAAYFTHGIRTLGDSAASRNPIVAAHVGGAASAMLRFMRDPRGELADEAVAALGQLASVPGLGASDAETRSLVAHGWIILRTQPQVDATLAELLAGTTAAQAQAFHTAYLDRHARIESRAQLARILLYGMSVALLAWLAWLWLLLWKNARALRSRLAFESVVVDISAHFVDLPADRAGAGIARAIARLGTHLGADRAYVLVFDDASRPGTDYAWIAPESVAPCEPPWTILPDLPSHADTGHALVRSVACLPPGRERSAMESRGTRSWLGLPIVHAGRRIGLLVLESVRREQRWTDDDIALLRTVSDIFASALERQRSETERKALEFRLRHSERMEAIGTLAGGIAHNFNNILTAILGYGDMAMTVIPSGSRARRYVEQMTGAGRRARQLVDQILAFGRRGGHEHRPIRVQPVLEESVRLLRASLPATVRLHPRFDAESAVLHGDPNQVQQVLMNLCTNAAQAMDGHGVVTIELDVVDTAGRQALSHGSLAPGRHVRLAVSDAGKGMDADTRERIFEPFFTTRAGAGGTGLGLASVHGIVADHGGALNVRSAPGRGSTFEAYFMLADAAPADDERAPAGPVPHGQGQTVLLVDDEPSLVLLGEEMLAALGYEPVGFDNSRDALAAIRADPHRFDLMLSDEVMPDVSGTQLAATMHAIRPELPILLMTAHGGAIDPRKLRAAGAREVLRKPLAARDLAESIARHLAR